MLRIACLFICFSLFPLAAESYAQQDDRRQNRSVGKGKKKKSPKDLEKKAEDEVTRRIKSAFFPDWAPPAFDWAVAPVVGYKLTFEQTDEGRSASSTGEIGIQGGLEGIPLIPGNPGISLAPFGGYALGRIDDTFEDPEGEKTDTSVRFERSWFGMNTIFLFKFYKHTLGISRGRRTFELERSDDDTATDPEPIQSFKVTNDFGFLILSWLSGHYTHTYNKVFGNQFDEPFFIEQDNWLHARMWTSFLSLYLDAGPGFTFVDEYAGKEKIATGRTDYFLAQSGATLFWKIGMTAQARYTYASSNEDLGNYATIPLPEQPVDAAPVVPMPEDSLVASMFFGIPNLAWGIGVGYRYNIQVLNYSEKNDTKKQTTKDQGFGVFFEASL